MDVPIPEGTLIGQRWRVAGTLGEGGFGRVFEAVDESDISLGRAAVKLLHPNISPQERNAFLGEVKKIAGLRHPNLVGYLDSGQITVDEEIHPFLVTELCVGSLSDHLANKQGGRLDAGESLSVLADVSLGLDHLHQRSLIHRDIKPGNVLYAEGNWKVADFGLMRDLTATGTYHRNGQLMGTPMFMAPELFSTMTANAASDIYALGVLAHLIGTGRPLHTATGAALVHQITNSPPAIDPDLYPGLRDLIAWATAIEPGDRPTARQFHDFAASHRADAASATRSVAMYPPPTAPGTPATTGAPAAPATHASLPDAAPATQASQADADPRTQVAPPTGAPAGPSTSAATAVQGSPGFAATEVQPGAPFGGGPSGPTTGGQPPTSGRGPLLPALVLASVVALGALGALAWVVLRGDGGDETATSTTTVDDANPDETTDGDPLADAPTDDPGADGEGDDGGGIDPAAQSGDIDATPSVQPQAADAGGGGPIDLSTPLTIDGEIAVALDRRAYTFDASAGEFVSVEVRSLNGNCEVGGRWDLELSILDPSGNPVNEFVDDSLTCNDGILWSIEADGEHTVLAQGGPGSSSRPPTGSFSLVVGKLLATETPVDLSAPLDIDGGILIARDRQDFLFEGTAGQRFSVEIISLNGGCQVGDRWDMAVAFIGPDDQPVGEIEDSLTCGDALGPWELTTDGPHRFTVFGGEGSTSRPPTGTFSLRLAALSG